MINYYINSCAISFDECIGSIVSIKKKNKEYIHSSLPLFSVKLRKHDNSSYIISSFDLTFKKRIKNSFVYENSDLLIKLFIYKINDGLSFKINVKNKTLDVIEWIEIPSFGLNPKLQDEENGEGSILFPYNEGCLVTNLKRRNNSPFPYIEPDYPSLGRFAIFPNMICSQFITYQTSDIGFYIGLHDPDRGTKHIDFTDVNNSLNLKTRVYSNKNYKEDFNSDFPIVLKIFDGDIYNGLNIYRKWFYSHLPNGVKKTEDNLKLLPKWYNSSPVVLVTPLRGHFDTDEMKPTKLFPYENALPLLDDFKEKIKAPIMYILMHYESTAPWAPPYMFPPYGGFELFDSFVKKIHKNNYYLGLYCSGFGYTIQSNLIKTYNKEEEFVKNNYKSIMCSNSDGEILSTICEAQRKGYDLCPSLEKSKFLFVNEMNKVINSGVDYVQALDQNHGGCSYFCYSDKHQHPPVPGKWQQIEVNKTLDMLSKPKRVLIGTESGASEPFITKLKFSDNRFNLNYYIGLPFPLYSYIYHEFLHNFMGNQICNTLSKEEYNYTYRLAYSFICGDNLTAVITDEGEISNSWCERINTNKEVAISFLKNLSNWKLHLGKDYLNYGKMIKPIKFKTNYKTFKCEDSTIINVLGAQTGAFKLKNKKVQFIVNYQLNSITIQFDSKYKIYTNPLTKQFLISDNIEIKPLDAIMIELR